jgi:hypothetical protein
MAIDGREQELRALVADADDAVIGVEDQLARIGADC